GGYTPFRSNTYGYNYQPPINIGGQTPLPGMQQLYQLPTLNIPGQSGQTPLVQSGGLSQLVQGLSGMTPMNQGLSGMTPMNQGLSGMTPMNQGLSGMTPMNQGLSGMTPMNQGLSGMTPMNQGIQQSNTPITIQGSNTPLISGNTPYNVGMNLSGNTPYQSNTPYNTIQQGTPFNINQSTPFGSNTPIGIGNIQSTPYATNSTTPYRGIDIQPKTE
ncbi:MAG: hypothetical protein EZS28_052440, partial [Streblomastix strix]